MQVLLSWATDDDDNGNGGGGWIRPPSSCRRARRAAELLARDASYSNLCPPPQGRGRRLTSRGPAAGTRDAGHATVACSRR
jgi:hypothetical protein